MKRFFGLYIIFFLLVLAVPVRAQDEPLMPEPVGLRPDAPAYALHGPYWVGTQEFVIESGERSLPVSVWYPALNPEGITAEIDYVPFYDYFTSISPVLTGHALLAAAPDNSGAPYPLVVHSHGSVTVRHLSSALLENLASYGFVVIAPNHTGDTSADLLGFFAGQVDEDTFVETQMMAFANRPLDIRRTIDFADELTAQGGALEGLIDTETIGVTGYSFGSYTALLAGGARFDVAAITSWCKAHPDLMRIANDTPTEICMMVDQPDWQSKYAAVLGLDAPATGLWPALNDPRVDAVAAIAPCYAMGFGVEGVQALKVPSLFLVSGSDANCEPDYMGYPFYENVGSTDKAMAVFENATHYIFNWTCAESMIEAGWYSVCSDPVWDMARTHDLENHFTTAFLLGELKGDADAAAALAPDAVSFPGILYEAEGF